MATQSLPDPTMKRNLLHGEADADWQMYGDMFFEKQRYNDALDFYARGGLTESLRNLKAVAVEEGDYFILRRLKKLLADEITDGDWEALARRAQAKGNENFVKWADEERGKRGANGGHEGEER
jgi:hypothetical protein